MCDISNHYCCVLQNVIPPIGILYSTVQKASNLFEPSLSILQSNNQFQFSDGKYIWIPVTLELTLTSEILVNPNGSFLGNTKILLSTAIWPFKYPWLVSSYLCLTKWENLIDEIYTHANDIVCVPRQKLFSTNTDGSRKENIYNFCDSIEGYWTMCLWVACSKRKINSEKSSLKR